MENREIEFTVKANTQPIEASMQKLTDDIATGKKSMSQFAKELESMSTIKIDGITKVLNSELKTSKTIVKEIEGALTGQEQSILVTQNITSGHNGNLSNFSSMAWHIRTKWQLTGARPARLVWQMKKWLTVIASVAAARLFIRKKANGCLKSPTMPKSCSTDSTTLILSTA